MEDCELSPIQLFVPPPGSHTLRVMRLLVSFVTVALLTVVGQYDPSVLLSTWTQPSSDSSVGPARPCCRKARW